MKQLLLGLGALLLATLGASAQTVPTPPIVAMGCAYNATPLTPTDKNFFLVQCDNTGKLITSGSGGGGGTSSTFGAAFPATGTAIGVKNGANMVNLIADGSGNLDINCAVGCGGAGTTSNATSGVATSSTNAATVAWLYLFNGTTWDQAQADASKNLKVNVNAALPTGANTIGAVTQASGPWTQNITQFGGSSVATGTGTGGAGIPRVTVSSDSFPATQPVSGTVTANAGSNLNTSLLALESGGNLATLATTLGASTDGVWSGTGVSTITQTDRAIYNAIIAPITPCATSNCGAANPIGTVLVGGTVPLPTGAATSALQPTNAAQGAAIAGATGNMGQAEALGTPPTYVTATINPLVMDLAGDLQTGNQSFALTPNGGMTVTVASHGAGTVIGTGSSSHGMQFTKTGAYGRIQSITVSSKAIATVGFKAYVFRVIPATAFTEASAPAIVAGDVNNIIGVVNLNPADSGLGTHTVWTSQSSAGGGGLNIPVNSTNFYIVLISTGSAAYTPGTTSDLNMEVIGNY